MKYEDVLHTNFTIYIKAFSTSMGIVLFWFAVFGLLLLFKSQVLFFKAFKSEKE